jgi:hypothetical protein
MGVLKCNSQFSGKETGALEGYFVYFDPAATISSNSELWGGSNIHFEGSCI